METIKLDLIPGKKMPSLHASQYDDGRDYHIDLTENRVPYTLDGTETISLTVRKCDNTLVTMDIANVFGGKSYIEFRTTEQMNACAGFNYGEIVLEENGTRIGSLNFYLQVEEAPDEGGVSQSEINNLARQVEELVDEEMGDYLLKTEAEETYATITALETLSGVVDTKANESDLETLAGVVDTKASKTYVDNVVSPKADKTYVDTELDKKADKSNTYTKTETDSLVSPKADKSYVDSVADTKADKATTYTKTEVDEKFATKTSLSEVATSGDYNDLLNKPSVAVIDDTQASASKVYSSEKTEQEIDKILPTGIASGSICNFETDLTLPLVSSKFDIVATQESGTPTHTSPIPIVGFDNVVVTQADGEMQTVETVTIALGNTIYGGYVTQDKDSKRQLIITYTVNKVSDVEMLYYAVSSSYPLGFFYCKVSPAKKVGAKNISCSFLRTTSGGWSNDDSIFGSASIQNFYIICSAYTSVEQIKAAHGNEIIKYELDQPIIIDLADGEPITTLAGVNNIYANSGNSEVVYKKSNTFVSNTIESFKETDVLFGKTLVCCGDSITYGSDIDSEGITNVSNVTMYQSDNSGNFSKVTSQFRKTWGYQIAERNKMIFYNAGVGGSTMQGISARAGFSLANGRYTKLPDNIDYLLIWFGWNDANYGSLGTINDNTNESYYGGYNVVLPYLINKYPYAKIALVVPFGTDENHRNAVRLLGNKWGVAVWDNYQGGTPLYFGKESSVGVDASIVTANRTKFQVGVSNPHPNYKGHIQLGNMIEQFLRGI